MPSDLRAQRHPPQVRGGAAQVANKRCQGMERLPRIASHVHQAERATVAVHALKPLDHRDTLNQPENIGLDQCIGLEAFAQF